MDSIITWDFSHGSKVAQQVRRRFKSSVHLQDGLPLPGFFLVAEFVKYNFDLNTANVALALESCIGGYADRLQVQWLRGQIFKFRVASNRVGHFIHNLEFFKCVDFTCYFLLFHGNEQFYRLDLKVREDDWIKAASNRSKPKPFYLSKFPDHLKGKKDGISLRSIAIKPDLGILYKSATSDPLLVDQSKDNSTILNNIKIGSFSFSEGADRISNSSMLPLQFGKNASRRRNIFHEDFSLDTIQDLIQAGYTPSDLIGYVKKFKTACTRCISLGHINIHCKNQVRCMGCLKFGHMKKDCPAPIIPGQPLYPYFKESEVVTPQDKILYNSDSAKMVFTRTLPKKQIWVKKNLGFYSVFGV
jgi:hypothetical protein